MKLGDLVKNAPNALIYSVALCFLGILAAFTVLSATGADTTDLRSFLNLVLNIASGLFSGGALVVAGAAAKSSANAERQTNGELDGKIENAVRRAVYSPDSGNLPDER